MKIQQIEARSELETALLEIRTLSGLDVAEPLRLAPQAERPPRLDLGLNELTETALRERADLQAAVIGERTRLGAHKFGEIAGDAERLRFRPFFALERNYRFTGDGRWRDIRRYGQRIDLRRFG